MTADFDSLIEVVGGFGRYQKYLIIFVLIPISAYVGIQSNTIVFQTHVPEHWCYVPGRNDTTYSIQQWKEMTIPKRSDGTFENCRQFELYWRDSSKGKTPVAKKRTKGCEAGMEHNTTNFEHTTGTYHGWLCGQASGHSTHILSATLAGSAAGTLIFPALADNFFGRRRMFFFVIGQLIVTNLIVSWVPTYTLHLVFRFLAGMTFQSNYQLPYIIVLELVPANRRSLVTFISFIVWTLGMCLTSLLALALPHWIYLNAFTVLPAIFFFALWRVLPESPRLLLAKGEITECSAIFRKIAETNNKPIPSDLLKTLKREKAEADKDGPIVDLSRYPTLKRRAVLLFIQCACAYLLYGCLLINITILPENIFLNHFILSLCELPSDVLGGLTAHFFGRRAGAVGAFLVCSISMAIAAVFSDHAWIVLSMCGVAKLFVVLALYVVYLMITETYPTPIRSSGFGLTTVMGMLAMAAAPYVADLSRSYPPLQYWVMLGLSILGAIVTLPLPETLGLPLPQTMLEADQLGKHQPFCSWIHHWNQHHYLPVTNEDYRDEETELRDRL